MVIKLIMNAMISPSNTRQERGNRSWSHIGLKKRGKRFSFDFYNRFSKRGHNRSKARHKALPETLCFRTEKANSICEFASRRDSFPDFSYE